jgi:hypothetical protein
MCGDIVVPKESIRGCSTFTLNPYQCHFEVDFALWCKNSEQEIIEHHRVNGEIDADYLKGFLDKGTVTFSRPSDTEEYTQIGYEIDYSTEDIIKYEPAGFLFKSETGFFVRLTKKQAAQKTTKTLKF